MGLQSYLITLFFAPPIGAVVPEHLVGLRAPLKPDLDIDLAGSDDGFWCGPLECSVALLQMQARIRQPEAATAQTEMEDLGQSWPSRIEDPQPSWTYADAATWPDIYPSCAKGLQSPIDISAKALGLLDGTFIEGNDRLDARLHYHKVAGESLSIKNGGHSVQVAGIFGTLKLPAGDYVARLFHFHFPAEHAIYGEMAEGELHIVHTRVGAADMEGLVVVAILLKDIAKLGVNNVTKSQVEFLRNIGFPDRLPFPNDEIPLNSNVSVDLASTYAEEFAGPYYHYEGSLTSPPCPGHAHWYVLQDAAAVDVRMIEKFKSLFPAHRNNRPLQPLAGRKVTISTPKTRDSEFD